MDVTLEDLQAALDNVEQAFREAPAEGGSIYDPPPDDDYEALVNEIAFIAWEAKNGNPAGIGLKVNYQVTNHSTYSGRICGAMFSLTPERIGYLKGWLNTMGVDVENFDLQQLRPEPGSVLYSLLDVPVLIRVKRNRSNDGRLFVNVYLQQRLGDAVQTSDVTDRQAGFDFGAPAVGVGRNATDDDIPF